MVITDRDGFNTIVIGEIMTLKFKPDFAETRAAWDCYWHGECLKRPLVVIQTPNPDRPPSGLSDLYWNAVHRLWDKQFAQMDAWMESTLFLGESVPFMSPDLGASQFAAFFGGNLKFSPDSRHTNWCDPFVSDWREALPLKIDGENAVWQTIIEYAQRLAEHARGKFLVGMIDLHSNADALAAMRGTQDFCTDLLDCPDLVERAMLDVRRAYAKVYDSIYEAGGMSGETGTIGWIPFWCEGRFAVIESDFICMVSPETSRRFIIPALEEEASSLDHCVFHLDGAGALPHLNDILSIKKIDAIQWVSGDGQPPMHQWTDVLKKCQEAGKGLQVYDLRFEDIKRLHRELKPDGVVYCPNVRDAAEAREIIKWLERNT